MVIRNEFWLIKQINYEKSKAMVKCTCKTETIDEHFCPYKADIYDDYEDLCKCCDVCTEECAWDV